MAKRISRDGLASKNYSKKKERKKKFVIFLFLTLLLEAKVEPSQRFEALELEGVVDHGGQLGVEQVLALVVAEPGVDHLIAEDVKDFLVPHCFLVRLQTGTGKKKKKKKKKIFVFFFFFF